MTALGDGTPNDLKVAFEFAAQRSPLNLIIVNKKMFCKKVAFISYFFNGKTLMLTSIS